ncbi:MAG TPA: glycosyltransferase family 4 protein [Armatimonadota bacterium]
MAKVLFLTTSLATGGPTGVVARMAQALHKRGVECQIWGISTPEPGVQIATDVPVRSLGLPKNAIYSSTTRRLATELAAWAPDLLHIHSYTTHVHGVQAAEQAGIKHVLVSFHDFRLGARRARHCRRLRPHVERVIVLNETMRELYLQHCGYAPEQLVVLPNAVDTEEFSPRPRDEALAAEWGLRPEHWVIGAIGGLNPNKGHRYLVQAFVTVAAALPAARLVLVGDGRDRAALERQVARHHLTDRVIFAGRQLETARWLSLFNVLAQPSRIESDPLAVHEAMAMGLPIVSTNRGGMPELLAGGDAGLLVPPARPAALAAALLELYADPDQARALGDRARHLAVTKYDIKDYEQRLWELYEPLLAEVEAEKQSR